MQISAIQLFIDQFDVYHTHFLQTSITSTIARILTDEKCHWKQCDVPVSPYQEWSFLGLRIMMGQARKAPKDCWSSDPTICTPNIETMLKTYIQEVVDSYLGWDTSYCDWGLYGFPQSLKASSGILPQLGFDPFLPIPCLFIICLSSYQLALCSVNMKKHHQPTWKKIMHSHFFCQTLNINCFDTFC
jgi:hypothetical protein